MASTHGKIAPCGNYIKGPSAVLQANAPEDHIWTVLEEPKNFVKLYPLALICTELQQITPYRFRVDDRNLSEFLGKPADQHEVHENRSALVTDIPSAHIPAPDHARAEVLS